MNTDDNIKIKIDTPKIDPTRHVNQILKHMVDVGGSDAFFLTGDKVWISRYSKKIPIVNRILDKKDLEGIIAYITKSPASIAKLGKGEKVDHAYEIKEKVKTEDGFEVKRLRFRINAIQSRRSGVTGITITCRTIPSEPPKASDLGVEQKMIDLVKYSKQGLVLVSGGTGHGKSTLMASLLAEAITSEDGNHNLVTIESPVEFTFDTLYKPSSFCTQIQVGKGQGVDTFSDGVENALRMAPSIIEIGETRDRGTAIAALDASNTGHLVLTTLHANTAAGTIDRYVSLFDTDSEKQRAANNLINETKLIVSQRLVPTIDGKRTAIREYIYLNKEVREFILEDTSNITQRVSLAVEKFGHSMLKDIQLKLDQNIISEEEARKLRYSYE